MPLFPVAVVGLLASGGYMTHARFTWTTPWIGAALIGLALIVSLGNGIEGSRARALERELAAGGLSPRARRLLRDPLSWSAKTTTLTLFAAVIFVMTAKPAATECAVVLLTALVTGVLAAVPLWRDPGVVAASASMDGASS